MFAHHMAWNSAGLGKLPYRAVSLQKDLNNSEANGVGNGSQARRRLLQNLDCQEIFLDFYVTVSHDIESIYRELSICQPFFSLYHIVLFF